MSQKALSSLVKSTLAHSAKGSSMARKERVKLQVLRAYQARYKKSLFQIWLGRLAWLSPLAFAGLMVGFIPQLMTPQTVAGELRPTFGPVEVIRGEETFLAAEPTTLYVGDRVLVRKQGQAEIRMPNQMVSTVYERSDVAISGTSELFVQRGAMEGKVMAGGDVQTSKGIIKSQPGARFNLSVNDTGETRISSQKARLDIFDTKNGMMTLNPGEALFLRSDTVLGEMLEASNRLEGEDFLTADQKTRVLAQLGITRSKILNGLEQQIDREVAQAQTTFRSAEKSFLSIANALMTDIERQQAWRPDLENLKVLEIYSKVAHKTNDLTLLAEVKAVETMFDILRLNRGKMAFGKARSGVAEFDRFVLLNHLFSLGSNEQRGYLNLLTEYYGDSFVRRIEATDPGRLAQVTALAQELKKLPEHPLSEAFVIKLGEVSEGVLQEVLQDYIENTVF